MFQPAIAMSLVLYIDDTENNRILVTRRLERNGYRVVTADNAEAGLAAASVEMPDIILMDMGMPGLDGWNATRQLKADAKLSPIPVIALTAHAMHGDREKALEAGCDDYETKPFDFPRLFGKMESLLAARRKGGT
jgi:two-component system cell cycle response regulator DivK